MTRESFLAQIDDFLGRTGMTVARFGREAVNDPGLVTRLRGGGDITLGNAERVLAFMAKHESERRSGSAEAAA